MTRQLEDTKATPAMSEHFDKAASTYEEAGGGLTRVISRHILNNLLTRPLGPGSVILDNAAGPGITATEIVKNTSDGGLPKEIHAVDYSAPMIKELEKQDFPQIQGQVMDMQDLKFADDKFTHSFCCFAIFTAPDAIKAAQEMYRTLRPGGTAYITTWQSLAWVPIVDRAIHRVKPEAPEYSGLLDPAWSTAEKLKSVLVAGGFKISQIDAVRFEPKTEPTFWQGALRFVQSPLVSGSITKDWKEEEKTQFTKILNEEVQNEMERSERANMPCWIAIATK